MSRQSCERPNCTNPAVALVADIEPPTFNEAPMPSSLFLCAHHAPADVEARS